MQGKIPAVIMRGGTSKGLFLKMEDMPFFSDKEKRDKIILSLFGSPDPMQIDGLGGTYSHTSKVMIVEPSTRPSFDVDYTFGQVAVDKPLIDYGGNCGNLTSAIGPFAIDEGMVRAKEPLAILNLYNTNTKKKIIAEVPVENGRAKVEGDYTIDGVPGTGAKIVTRFIDPGGTLTDSLLPTGNLIDEIDTGQEVVRCSIVDATNPLVFVKAEDIGLSGEELPPQLNGNKEILAKIERIRSTAAEIIGIVDDRKKATNISPGVPKIAFVAKSKNYISSLGKEIKAEEINLIARIMSMQKMHHAYAATGAMCTAATAKIKGTVVNEVTKLDGEEVTIGHPKGVIKIGVKIDSSSEKSPKVKEIIVTRTARRLMEGYAYYRG